VFDSNSVIVNENLAVTKKNTYQELLNYCYVWSPERAFALKFDPRRYSHNLALNG